VHFIVSRQICLPTPDILQEAPWGMDGPPPYSPVDIEQTLLVSGTHKTRQEQHQHAGKSFVPPSPHPKINIPFQVQMIHGGIMKLVIQAVRWTVFSSHGAVAFTSAIFSSPHRQKHPVALQGGCRVSPVIITQRLFPSQLLYITVPKNALYLQLKHYRCTLG